MADTTIKRYRPSTYADPQLNLDMKTAYDQIYSLNDNALFAAETNSELVSGQTTVKNGVANRVATGLASASNVVAVLDTGGSPVNEWVVATPTPNAKGLINLAVFMPTAAGNNTPIASTTDRLVRWFAFGQRQEPTG